MASGLRSVTLRQLAADLQWWDEIAIQTSKLRKAHDHKQNMTVEGRNLFGEECDWTKNTIRFLMQRSTYDPQWYIRDKLKYGGVTVDEIKCNTTDAFFFDFVEGSFCLFGTLKIFDNLHVSNDNALHWTHNISKMRYKPPIIAKHA